MSVALHWHKVYVDYLDNKFSKDDILSLLQKPPMNIRSHVNRGDIYSASWLGFISNIVKGEYSNTDSCERIIKESFEYFYTVGNVDLVKTFSKYIKEEFILRWKTEFDYFHNLPITPG